jgi:hypothetical protein
MGIAKKVIDSFFAANYHFSPYPKKSWERTFTPQTEP